MTVKQFVDEILCVPVTRIGYKYIVEAIELVLDTQDHKFYGRLSEVTQMKKARLEKEMRTAKNLSLLYMPKSMYAEVFGTMNHQTTSEYILKSTEYYRRKYAHKE